MPSYWGQLPYKSNTPFMWQYNRLEKMNKNIEMKGWEITHLWSMEKNNGIFYVTPRNMPLRQIRKRISSWEIFFFCVLKLPVNFHFVLDKIMDKIIERYTYEWIPEERCALFRGPVEWVRRQKNSMFYKCDVIKPNVSP